MKRRDRLAGIASLCLFGCGPPGGGDFEALPACADFGFPNLARSENVQVRCRYPMNQEDLFGVDSKRCVTQGGKGVVCLSRTNLFKIVCIFL